VWHISFQTLKLSFNHRELAQVRNRVGQRTGYRRDPTTVRPKYEAGWNELFADDWQLAVELRRTKMLLLVLLLTRSSR